MGEGPQATTWPRERGHATQLSQRWRRLWIAVGLWLGAAAGELVQAQQSAPPTTEATANSAPGARYGNTPEALMPYGRYEEPYYRYFNEVTPFRGTGSEQKLDAMPATVRLGFLAPSPAAPDAELGEEIYEGITLAIEEANAEGGMKGTLFELVRRNEGTAWGSSANEMIAFRYEDQVLAVLGSIESASNHVALRVSLRTKMPIVNTATTDPTLTEHRVPWMVRCMADDRQQGYALAHHVIVESELGNIVALRVNDRYGRAGMPEFRDAARRLGHPLRAELRFNPGDRDFRSQLDRIAELHPQAVVLWARASDAAAIVRAMADRGWRDPTSPGFVRVFGSDRLASESFVREAGEAAEGVTAVASFDPTRDDEAWTRFVAAYTQRFGRKPGTFAAHAYDGARILVEAVREAGPNRIRIRDALAGRTRYEGVTGTIPFDTTHNDVGGVYIATVRSGRLSFRPSEFTRTSRADSPVAPYFAMTQSPPKARSATHATENATGEVRLGCFFPQDEPGRAATRGVEMAVAEDRELHPSDSAIRVAARNVRGQWGEDTAALVALAFEEKVIGLIGSTERRGTHLAEMLATKLHFPVLSLCADDPTITRIPMPWVFVLAPAAKSADADFVRRYRDRFGVEADDAARLGYDAATLVLRSIRGGARDRRTLRDAVAGSADNRGASGDFRFDAFGNRVESGSERIAGGGLPVAAAPMEPPAP